MSRISRLEEHNPELHSCLDQQLVFGGATPAEGTCDHGGDDQGHHRRRGWPGDRGTGAYSVGLVVLA